MVSRCRAHHHPALFCSLFRLHGPVRLNRTLPRFACGPCLEAHAIGDMSHVNFWRFRWFGELFIYFHPPASRCFNPIYPLGQRRIDSMIYFTFGLPFTNRQLTICVPLSFFSLLDE